MLFYFLGIIKNLADNQKLIFYKNEDRSRSILGRYESSVVNSKVSQYMSVTIFDKWRFYHTAWNDKNDIGCQLSGIGCRMPSVRCRVSSFSLTSGRETTDPAKFCLAISDFQSNCACLDDKAHGSQESLMF